MPEQPSLDEQNEIKKRAIRRVIVASVLVAAAIAALTVLTRYKSETSVTRTTTQGTALPSFAQPEPTAPAPEEMAAPPTTPPEQEAQPTTPPPPPPEVVNAPAPVPPAEPAPKAAKSVPVRPSTEAEVSARPAPAKPAATQTQTTARTTQEMQPAQPAKPIAEKAPLPAKGAEPAPKAYTVQLGVFSNPTNALQLQEKLTQSGIKSYTETKLNVGPFHSKAEADQALAKIRAMGVSAVVVPVK